MLEEDRIVRDRDGWTGLPSELTLWSKKLRTLRPVVLSREWCSSSLAASNPKEMTPCDPKKETRWTNQNVQCLLYSFTSDYNSLWNTFTPMSFIFFMTKTKKTKKKTQSSNAAESLYRKKLNLRSEVWMSGLTKHQRALFSSMSLSLELMSARWTRLHSSGITFCWRDKARPLKTCVPWWTYYSMRGTVL